jgi:hypothetical protein
MLKYAFLQPCKIEKRGCISKKMPTNLGISSLKNSSSKSADAGVPGARKPGKKYKVRFRFFEGNMSEKLTGKSSRSSNIPGFPEPGLRPLQTEDAGVPGRPGSQDKRQNFRVSFEKL